MAPEGIRVEAHTVPRPIRFAVLMPPNPSMRLFRNVIRQLCGVFGGTRSLIVECLPPALIPTESIRLLRIFDPDAVVLTRNLQIRDRERLAEFLDQNGINPLWVTTLHPGLAIQERTRGITWVPARTPASEQLASADSLHRPTPTDAAILGLTPDDGQVGPNVASDGSSLVAGTATYASALGGSMPLTQARAAPFIFHSTNSIQVAQLLWNIRAVMGPFMHGDQAAVESWSAARHSTDPATVVTLDTVPPMTSVHGASLVPLADLSWPLRLAARSMSEAYRIDLLPMDGDEVDVPLRSPWLLENQVRLGSAAGESAYAMEIGLRRQGSQRLTLPSRSAMNRGPLLPGGLASLWQPAVAIRLDRDGDFVAMAPASQTVFPHLVLRLPPAAECLTAIDKGTLYVRSDKGHYAQLTAEKFGGVPELAEVLRNRRFRSVLDAYRETDFRTLDEISSLAMEPLPSRNRAQFVKDQRLRIEDMVNRLVRQDVLIFGIREKCPTCKKTEFHRAGDFTRFVSCGRCGGESPVSGVPVVGYQLSTVVREFTRNDGCIGILANRALARRFGWGYFGPGINVGFEHEYRTSKNEHGEIDVFTFVGGQTYIGECKKDGAIDDDDRFKLRGVARRLRASGVVIATWDECPSGCTPACSDREGLAQSSDGALHKGGGNNGPYERILALRSELAPYAPVVVMCRGELLADA